MIEDVHIPVIHCCCQRCLFEFLEFTDKPPLRCRNQECRSAEWSFEEQPRLRSHDLAARRTRKGVRW